VEAVQQMDSGATLRLAFVGYRDHCDGARRLVVEDFVTDASQFMSKIKGEAVGPPPMVEPTS
jgi:hypothetical protein